MARPATPSSGVFTVLALAGALCASSAAEARVQVRTGDNGRTQIYSETPTQRARRTSSQLIPVPRSDIGYLIDRYSRHRGLSPRLVQAVIQVESGYNPRALSNKGAMGLMQLMPGTAAELGVDDPYDPSQNIRGGTGYLRRQLDRFSGDLTMALAAYNAGPTAVMKYDGVPPYPETRNYVQKVLGLYRGSPPPLLQEQARSVAKQRSVTERNNTDRQRKGKKVFLSRGTTGRISVTTSRPKTR